MEQMKSFGFKEILVLGIIILALLGGGYYYFSTRIEVTVGEVAFRTVDKIIEETGEVKSASAVIVGAKGAGTVANLPFSEGDEVASGALIAELSDSSSSDDVAGIRAQAAGIAAQYNAAKQISDRYKKLYEEGAVSYLDYTTALAQTNQLAAQLQALGYTASSVETATAAGGITSPIDGYITALYVKEGESVGPGSPIAEIGRMDDHIVSLHLIASDADYVKLGMKASVIFDGDEITNDAAVSKVALKASDYISALGIIQKRVLVEVSLPEGLSQRLGSTVDVEILVEQEKDVLSVSEKAIFEIEEEKYIYIIKGGKAVLTPVIVGLEGNDYVEIKEGLSEGDIVIISPGADIADGVRVKVE